MEQTTRFRTVDGEVVLELLCTGAGAAFFEIRLPTHGEGSHLDWRLAVLLVAAMVEVDHAGGRHP